MLSHPPTPPRLVTCLRPPAVGVLKGALTIAVRYSAQRQQFGPPDAPEVAVLDYPSQQVRCAALEEGWVGGREAGWTVCRPTDSFALHADPRRPATHPPTSLQMKLIPMLATCYALHFAKTRLVEK